MIRLNLELADTPIKRSYGLMDRKDLSKDDGMIFIFPRKARQNFWMKNTYIPLDIAFLDDSGKILQIESMSPLSTRAVYSNQECKYAIEVNQGWFLKNNIDVGFQMFSGDDWLMNLKRKAAKNNIRCAQADIDNEEAIIEPNQLDGTIPPEIEDEFNQEQDPSQELYDQAPQPNQVVEYNMDQVSKIKYAEVNNKQMDIVYWTLSGKVLPPRRLMPVPGEGYPIKHGPNGKYLVAYDSSPTIYGDGWTIEGGTPKNFLIDNIISLEIKDNEGEIPQEQEQTIEEPQNLWDRLKKLFYR